MDKCEQMVMIILINFVREFISVKLLIEGKRKGGSGKRCEFDFKGVWVMFVSVSAFPYNLACLGARRTWWHHFSSVLFAKKFLSSKSVRFFPSNSFLAMRKTRILTNFHFQSSHSILWSLLISNSLKIYKTFWVCYQKT